MIATLRGTILEKTSTRVIVEVGGVGYQLAIPVSTYSELPGVGREVALHAYTYVREDTLALYGFKSAQEKALFEVLITVSGVGPRLALTLLSGMPIQEIYDAIQDGDAQALTRVPGVGRKTGERIILEVREKIGPLAVAKGPTEGQSLPGAALENEVLSALVNLGCSPDAARKAVERVRRDGTKREFEQMFRRALTLMNR